jgi:hypothetical protein
MDALLLVHDMPRRISLSALSYKGHTRCNAAPLTFGGGELHAHTRNEMAKA